MQNLNYIEIGKRIQIKRKELKLTQETLSEIIDVSPSYVSEIERGCSVSSLATITKIAQALDLSLDYLIWGMTENNLNISFREIIKTIPEKNHILYFNLCQNIAETLKNS